MRVLVYGIARSDEQSIAGLGLQGRPMRGLQAGSLVTIVSDHTGAAPRPEVQALWDYERIVEQIARIRPVLPARFGSVLENENAVLEMMRARRDRLEAALALASGAVELALRATWHEAPHSERNAASGAAYMHARLELRRRTRELAAALEPLSALARRARCELLAASAGPVRCAYLVARERIGEFTESVARLDQGLSGVDLVCTGPWPPYSFAEVAG